MHPLMEKLPKNLSSYLQGLMAEEGFTTEDSKNRFVKNWLKKRALFDKIVEHNGFVVVESLGVDCSAGIILITYSGSILTISGEKQKKTRDVIYESIKLRQDHFPKTEEQAITIDFPIQLNKPVNLNGGKIVRTSPVFSLAVEKEDAGTPVDVNKRFELVRETISRALLQVNNTIFSATDRDSLETRDDLFQQWIILSRFRINGWKEEIFLARAHLLWVELFHTLYKECVSQIDVKAKQNQAFLDISNDHFIRYCTDHMLLDSENETIDTSHLHILEEIPEQKAYTEFMDNKINELVDTYT